VAENGAVLAVPSAAEGTVLAPTVPTALIEALSAADIPFRTGTCVVESDATFAVAIEASIRRAGVPYGLIFNRTRVMALPIGINKATGLREAARALDLSLRTTIAIGDGENDEDLLNAAGVGVAVSWGSDFLRASADEVLHGNGPAAVTTYIRRNILPRT
jgi:hypothetical protein